MKWVDAIQRYTSRSGGVRVATFPLRLTLGIVGASLVVTTGLSTWSAWKMQQMLIAEQTQELQSLAATLPEIPDAAQSELQQWLTQEAQSNVWLGVTRSNGELISQSSPAPADLLNGLKKPLSTPQIVVANDRHWLVQSHSAGNERLYMATEVSSSYAALIPSRPIRTAAILSLGTLAGLLPLLVWRSLHAMRRIDEALYSSDGKSQLHDASTAKEVQALAQTCSKLSHKLVKTGEQQRQFTNSMSHELRTSLSLIYGYLQSTLRRSSNLTPLQQESLEVAVTEVERMSDLLKDLLDLGRLNAGEIKLDREPLSLNALVSEVAESVITSDRPVKLMMPPQPLWVETDRAYLIRVLTHLLSNAVRYSPAHQPIAIEVSDHQGMAEIAITDRGCGIAAAHQPYIFDPLYRVDSSRCRATGGLGLGLAIAKTLIEGMGGEITVQSEPEVGSTFTVKLPIECHQGVKP